MPSQTLPTQVVLYRPLIPPNTGTIARTCAATRTPLHLIRPLGFSIDNRWVRRAGLDYWHAVNLACWDSLDDLLRAFPNVGHWWITKHGNVRYDQAEYAAGDLLIFGNETEGLPAERLQAESARTIYLPMTCDAVRSLNLANAVNVVLYESRRRLGILE